MKSLAKSVTWSYSARRSRNFRHGITADFGENKRDADKVTEAAQAIIQNPVLEGLVKNLDYQWFGPLGIAFRRKDRAALFLLFAPEI